MNNSEKYLFAHHGRNTKPDLQTVEIFDSYEQALAYAEGDIMFTNKAYVKNISYKKAT